MWFKNGLKAQKLLAQGSALGNYGNKPVADCYYTQGDALG